MNNNTLPTSSFSNYLNNPESTRSLGNRSVRGGTYTVISQVSKIILLTITTGVLARILTRADFGLLAMVATVTTFINLFKDLGLSMAVVQNKFLTHDQVSVLFWINVLVGICAFILTALLSPVVAWFYNDNELRSLTIVLGFAFIISAVSTQQQAILRRRMEFGRLAIITITSDLLSAILAIWSAVIGAGYWALAIQQISQVFLLTLGLWIVCKWRPSKPKRNTNVQSLLHFGGHIVAFNIVNYFSRNLDTIVIGKKWGDDILGLYSRAYGLLLMPLALINTPLSVVGIPALSKLQSNPDQFRSFYLRAIRMILATGIPIVVFSFCDAREIILTVLGEKFRDSIILFRWLAPAALIGTTGVVTGWVYVSLGHTKRQLQWAILEAILLSVTFLVTVRWGAVYVAAGFSIIACTMRIPGIVFCYSGTPIALKDFLETIWKPLLLSLTTGFFLWLFKSMMPSLFHPVANAAIDLIVFLAFYTIGWLLIPGGKQVVHEFILTIRELRTSP